MFLRHFPLLSLLLGVSSPLLSAQVVVDPGGGGHYRDLQVAIDAVPSGAVIEVRGGVYGAVRIQSKSLTIYGRPAPTIQAPVTGTGVQPPALTIRGSGSEHITLANLTLGGGLVGPVSWNQVGPAVDAADVGRISMFGLTCAAPEYQFPSGFAIGREGMSARRVSLLRLMDCRVSGSNSWPISGSNPRNIPNGPAGIDTDGAVELVRSSVSGGSVNGYVAYFGQPSPAPCPCPGFGGVGGDAVRASSLHATGSQLTVGTGASIYYRPPVPPLPWGRQNPGRRYSGQSFRTARVGLTAAVPMAIGRAWTGTLSPVMGPKAVLVGVPGAGVQAVGSLDIFAHLMGPLVVVPVTGSSITLTVPNQAPLLGEQVVLQVLQPTAASGPHFELIGR